MAETDSEPTEKPHYHGHRARLRARFLESGGAGIPDYEILELILFGVFRNGDVKPLAKALVDEFGSLAAALAAPTERLKQVPGCGEVVIAALKVTREAGLRMLKADAMQRLAHFQLAGPPRLLSRSFAARRHRAVPHSVSRSEKSGDRRRGAAARYD